MSLHARSAGRCRSWAAPRMRCAGRAQSMVGHNHEVRQLAEEVRAIDASTEIDPAGLVLGTLLRPADILTGAGGGSLTALDVGISSTDAAGAGDDPIETITCFSGAATGANTPLPSSICAISLDELPGAGTPVSVCGCCVCVCVSSACLFMSLSVCFVLLNVLVFPVFLC